MSSALRCACLIEALIIFNKYQTPYQVLNSNTRNHTFTFFGAFCRPYPVSWTLSISQAFSTRTVIKCANLNVTKILVCATAILSSLGRKNAISQLTTAHFLSKLLLPTVLFSSKHFSLPKTSHLQTIRPIFLMIAENDFVLIQK